MTNTPQQPLRHQQPTATALTHQLDAPSPTSSAPTTTPTPTDTCHLFEEAAGSVVR